MDKSSYNPVENVSGGYWYSSLTSGICSGCKACVSMQKHIVSFVKYRRYIIVDLFMDVPNIDSVCSSRKCENALGKFSTPIRLVSHDDIPL